MKKLSTLLLLTAGLILTACNGEKPVPEGTTFPRVQLIEHFTGQSCGYCPYGMDLIYDVYSTNPDGYVWISNHTYGKDDYTITESNIISNKLGVSSAPSISINRVKHEKAFNYHPYYIAEYMADEATTATSMITIDRTYIAAANNLTINISGVTSDKSLESVTLTVALIESGLVGSQADNVNCWSGWRKFTHTHAVRAYISKPLGDLVEVKKQAFSATYTTSLEAGWVDENCEIVAWITPGNNFTPVLNAAKMPVVEGSKGGEDILYGGIEEVPVADSYPESGAPAKELRMTNATAVILSENGKTYAVLQAFNQDTTLGTYQGLSIYPCAIIYMLLPAGETAIPTSTFHFVDGASAQAGDAIAGYRDDGKHEVLGSQLYYLFTYQRENYLSKQWMLVGGSITFTEAGFELTATTKNGSSVHATYTGSIRTGQAAGAPARDLPKKACF